MADLTLCTAFTIRPQHIRTESKEKKKCTLTYVCPFMLSLPMNVITFVRNANSHTHKRIHMNSNIVHVTAYNLFYLFWSQMEIGMVLQRHCRSTNTHTDTDTQKPYTAPLNKCAKFNKLLDEDVKKQNHYRKFDRKIKCVSVFLYVKCVKWRLVYASSCFSFVCLALLMLFRKRLACLQRIHLCTQHSSDRCVPKFFLTCACTYVRASWFFFSISMFRLL